MIYVWLAQPCLNYISASIRIGPLYDPPEVDELVASMKTVGDWYTMGLKLGIPTHELDSIKSERSVANQKRRMFNIWLEEAEEAEETPTWDDIIVILKDLGISRPAENIQKRYSMC